MPKHQVGPGTIAVARGSSERGWPCRGTMRTPRRRRFLGSHGDPQHRASGGQRLESTPTRPHCHHSGEEKGCRGTGMSVQTLPVDRKGRYERTGTFSNSHSGDPAWASPEAGHSMGTPTNARIWTLQSTSSAVLPIWRLLQILDLKNHTSVSVDSF